MLIRPPIRLIISLIGLIRQHIRLIRPRIRLNRPPIWPLNGLMRQKTLMTLTLTTLTLTHLPWTLFTLVFFLSHFSPTGWCSTRLPQRPATSSQLWAAWSLTSSGCRCGRHGSSWRTAAWQPRRRSSYGRCNSPTSSTGPVINIGWCWLSNNFIFVL